MIEPIRTAAIFVFVLLGLLFTFVSTTGVIRLPDLYSRAHTASQADTLGAGFALAGVALSLGWGLTAFKTVLLLFFIFVTNPTAAHAIARAADEEGIEAWTTHDGRSDEELAAAAGAAATDGPATEGETASVADGAVTPGPGDDRPRTDGAGDPTTDDPRGEEE